MILLAGCSSDESGFDPNGKPLFLDSKAKRTPPDVMMPEYVGANQQAWDDGVRSALIDISNTHRGYIAVQCNAPTKAVLRMENAGASYNYVLTGGGEMDFLPLAMGNGFYTFSLLLQLEGQEYELFLSSQAEVTLEDEKLPFLVPSKVVSYHPGSNAVQLSYELAEHATSNLEVAQQVYYWIEKNISYDTLKARELAEASVSDYQPDPDRTIEEKKGICYDYAVLAATMLRANGIPCKLIMGNVDTEEGGTVYHAWNMIWLEEEGWLTVKLPTTPSEWQRIDLTFAASSGPSADEFIGDGNNYMETSVH